MGQADTTRGSGWYRGKKNEERGREVACEPGRARFAEKAMRMRKKRVRWKFVQLARQRRVRGLLPQPRQGCHQQGSTDWLSTSPLSPLDFTSQHRAAPRLPAAPPSTQPPSSCTVSTSSRAVLTGALSLYLRQGKVLLLPASATGLPGCICPRCS